MTPATRRQPAGRQARIQDVAARAGVSVPTVSRVLTGSTPVSPPLRDRVLRAIDELGYRPSGTARALVRGTSEIIAVMTSSTSIHGYSATIEGIESAAKRAGYFVIIFVVESADQETVDGAIRLVLGQPLAGVAVLNFDLIGEQVGRSLPSEIPVVTASGRPSPRRAYAGIDENAGGELVTQYLLGLGHRTVHHITVPQPGHATRTAGWRRALASAGAVVPEPLNSPAYTSGAGVPIGRELADMPEVTAVFAGNDEVAMGVIAGLSDRGLSVPGDVSVAGFDDHPMAAIWRPALTTVAQDFASLGGEIFALLHAQLDGDAEPARHIQQPRLVVRASASVPPSRDGAVRSRR